MFECYDNSIKCEKGFVVIVALGFQTLEIAIFVTRLSSIETSSLRNTIWSANLELRREYP